jgi:protein subunit release factor A
MSERRLISRVTIKDCDVQTFRAGGPGGQNQNVRETAVRIVHAPSGSVGECREQRHQWQNKKIAFRRMAETNEFNVWVRSKTNDLPPARSMERVRTYNLIDNYVKDHRTKRTSKSVRRVLDGDLDQIR